MMKLRPKLVLMLGLFLLLVISRQLLERCPAAVFSYDRLLYYPLQAGRMAVWGWLPFSLGDVIYVAGGALLFIALIKIFRCAVRFRTSSTRLGHLVLNLLNWVFAACNLFVLGWGANYYKPGLKQMWALSTVTQFDTNALRAFDSTLVGQVNFYAPHYLSAPFKVTEKRSVAAYRNCTDSRLAAVGLEVKPTLFGYFMDRIAVDGYYNPFTGEGQVAGSVPHFMQPFVICHEMAHQAGIAAEDDANLMAYAVCTACADSSFRYSAYLNLWLYTNARLYRRDSAAASRFKAQLNKLTAAHLDTLDELSKKYRNEAARYSSKIYDSYLKMQDQEMGIRSYSNVSYTAWLLELKRRSGPPATIHIP